ncbi:MAG: riboflavin biosynthesis protein RibF [Vampirovibrionales bacterium]|nr:riboflavin biosynthesis protein RibF [Vampirovibrionales bacterium]
MRVYHQLPSSSAATTPKAMALGTFDGVHAGHKAVLQSALHQAHVLGVAPTVWTFANHPQSVLSHTPPKLLTTLEERLTLMEAMGFTDAYVIPFDDAVRTITPEDFLTDWLYERCEARSLSVGYDFCFGRNREGNSQTLTQWGQQNTVGIHIIPPVMANLHQGDLIVSSTVIRKLVTFGDVEQARQLLERPYTLTAPVVEGFQRGRKLGFPTANLCMTTLMNHHRVLPALGVYAGWAAMEGHSTPLMAVANMGLSPTFETITPAERLEVHLLEAPIGLDLNILYGQTLSFAMTHRLRGEHIFSSVDALKTQIALDCDAASQLLGNDADTFQPLTFSVAHQAQTKACDPSAAVP